MQKAPFPPLGLWLVDRFVGGREARRAGAVSGPWPEGIAVNQAVAQSQLVPSRPCRVVRSAAGTASGEVVAQEFVGH